MMSYLVGFLLENREEAQDQYKEHTSQETWNWLRRMAAIYAPALNEAQSLSDKKDHARKYQKICARCSSVKLLKHPSLRPS